MHYSTGPQLDADTRLRILGVSILNVTRARAIQMLEEVLRCRDGRARTVYFVNAHTLNLAAADHAYCAVLNRADFVFADGTGVRWAARLQKVRVRDNLVGTDFTPALFQAACGQGYSYYLLGADARTVASAAEYARRRFPGWSLAGYHHGYLSDKRSTCAVIDQINQAAPDLLLVAMGNPIQERWLDAHRCRLRVRVALGVGGLFDYWAGNVSRAPLWLRRLGHEWLWRLFQQPRLKARRYLIGNPLFLARILRERCATARGRDRTCDPRAPDLTASLLHTADKARPRRPT